MGHYGHAGEWRNGAEHEDFCVFLENFQILFPFFPSRPIIKVRIQSWWTEKEIPGIFDAEEFYKKAFPKNASRPIIKVNEGYVFLGGNWIGLLLPWYIYETINIMKGKMTMNEMTDMNTEPLMVAYGDNNTHGLNLSSGDKKYSIVKALLRFPDKTLRILGKELGCTYSYISVIRKEMVANGELVEPDKRMGRDGIMRSTKRNNSTKPPNDFGTNEQPEQDDADGKEYGSLQKFAKSIPRGLKTKNILSEC